MDLLINKKINELTNKINDLDEKLDIMLNNQRIIIDTLWNLPIDYEHMELNDNNFEEFEETNE